MTVYFVFARTHVRNKVELDEYVKNAGATFASHPVKWLARGGQLEVKEGPTLESAVILEFPTMQDAKAWYESPEYQEVAKHRFLGADYSVFLVEGVSAENVH
jgi:uncharacterized protein (DUF1330 family)